MSSVVLDDTEQEEPTEEEILQYASWLGIDPVEDADLMWIANEGIRAPLPKGWKPCKAEDGNIFYHNFETQESLWDHPLDEHYKRLAREERGKKEKQKHQKQIIKKNKKKLKSAGISGTKMDSLFPMTKLGPLIGDKSVHSSSLSKLTLPSSQGVGIKSLLSGRSSSSSSGGETTSTLDSSAVSHLASAEQLNAEVEQKNGKIKQLEEELKKKNSLEEETKKMKIELEKEKEALRVVLESQKEKEGRIKRLEEELKEEITKNTSLQQKVKVLQNVEKLYEDSKKEASDLKKQLETHQSNDNAQNYLNERVKELELLNESLKGDLERMKSSEKVKDLQQLEKQKRDAENAQNLDAEKKKLEKEIVGLKKEIEMFKTRDDIFQKKQKELTVIEREKMGLKKKMEEESKKMKNLETQNMKLETDVKTLNSELKILSESEKQKDQTINSQNQKILELQGDIDNLTKQHNEFKYKVECKREESEKEKKERKLPQNEEKLAEELKMKQNEISDLKKRLDECMKDLNLKSNIHKEMDSLKKDISKKKEQIKNLEEKLKLTEQDKKMLEEKQKMIKVNQDRLKAVEEELEMYKKERDEIRKVLEDERSKFETIKSENVLLKKNLRELSEMVKEGDKKIVVSQKQDSSCKDMPDKEFYKDEQVILKDFESSGWIEEKNVFERKIGEESEKKDSFFIDPRIQQEREYLLKAQEFIKQQKLQVKKKKEMLEEARKEWKLDWEKASTFQEGDISDFGQIMRGVKKVLEQQANRLNSEVKQLNRLQRFVQLRNEKLKLLEQQLSQVYELSNASSFGIDHEKTEQESMDRTSLEDEHSPRQTSYSPHVEHMLQRIESELQVIKKEIKRFSKPLTKEGVAKEKRREYDYGTSNKENIPASKKHNIFNTKQKWDNYFEKICSNHPFPHVREQKLQEFEKLLCKICDERTWEQEVMSQHSQWLKKLGREMKDTYKPGNAKMPHN